ncbi:MAG: translation initiation factor IF-3, partial [Malacoplasma sp.]|nr:translation initiation factor IF-3 [Malacoplasma sp.]
MKERFINEQIRENSMLVIDENGQKLGIMDKNKALETAYDKDLDLVLMVPHNDKSPAICKIADYGKMLYEEKTKERQAKKNQHVTKVKEIKVRPQVGDNDLKWMSKNAIEWLQDNCQVKFKIRAFGRMATKPEVIQETYNKFLALLGDIAKVQTPLKKVTPVLY